MNILLEIVTDVPVSTDVHSSKFVLYSLVVTNIVVVVGMVIKAIVDWGNRVQDRLDRESNAKIAAALGEQRKNEILASTEAARKESANALKVANGHNEKIAQLAAQQNLPREVIVVNPQDKPVHVTKDMKLPPH